MAASIVPVAKTIYLCDHVLSMPIHGTLKTDIIGLVNSIRAPSFPHVATKFCAFAQLTGGLGLISAFFCAREACRDG